MKQEFVQVPVEVVRELKEMGEEIRLKPGHPVSACIALCFAIRKLPDPPKPDVVEAVQQKLHARGWHFSKETVEGTIRAYRELGCPELGE